MHSILNRLKPLLSRQRRSLRLAGLIICCLSLQSLGIDFRLPLLASYGKTVVARFEAWQDLIEDNQGSSDWQRLQAANQFANSRVAYMSDLRHWHVEDYWATPIETLTSAKGDCEDYAIFKYMTLLAMGMDESKLRLMYVRALTVDSPHIVLIYFSDPKAMPLVLDNLKDSILPAGQRPDLKPIYSFNGTGLWLARAQGLGKKVASSPGVKNWQLLQQRIEQGE
ncbi:transglutaminase-like cysteine peptidase [Shewanella sp. AS16]|uniref:transglutaminase-like cysteine peptidase n=1 Tax=Shewanella sp. AS16 TaxID=2907625 RepID=UPI001F31F52C|nr:transglutaminase-like cysteine peptidase [Shewanella sp. AS16]MCE9686985.1 transglutaminase-like cysteine peptidase [Shewanella sp. AS16]